MLSTCREGALPGDRGRTLSSLSGTWESGSELTVRVRLLAGRHQVEPTGHSEKSWGSGRSQPLPKQTGRAGERLPQMTPRHRDKLIEPWYPRVRDRRNGTSEPELKKKKEKKHN